MKLPDLPVEAYKRRLIAEFCIKTELMSIDDKKSHRKREDELHKFGRSLTDDLHSTISLVEFKTDRPHGNMMATSTEAELRIGKLVTEKQIPVLLKWLLNLPEGFVFKEIIIYED